MIEHPRKLVKIQLPPPKIKGKKRCEWSEVDVLFECPKLARLTEQEAEQLVAGIGRFLRD